MFLTLFFLHLSDYTITLALSLLLRIGRDCHISRQFSCCILRFKYKLLFLILIDSSNCIIPIQPQSATSKVFALYRLKKSLATKRFQTAKEVRTYIFYIQLSFYAARNSAIWIVKHCTIL